MWEIHDADSAVQFFCVVRSDGMLLQLLSIALAATCVFASPAESKHSSLVFGVQPNGLKHADIACAEDSNPVSKNMHLT